MVSVLHLGHNMFSVIHSGLKRAAVTNTSVQRPAQPPLHVPAQQPKANEPHRASEQVMGWFPMAMVGEAHPARREKEIYYLISANTITEAEEYRNWLCAGRGHREVCYNSKT